MNSDWIHNARRRRSVSTGSFLLFLRSSPTVFEWFASSGASRLLSWPRKYMSIASHTNTCRNFCGWAGAKGFVGVQLAASRERGKSVTRIASSSLVRNPGKKLRQVVTSKRTVYLAMTAAVADLASYAVECGSLSNRIMATRTKDRCSFHGDEALLTVLSHGSHRFRRCTRS